MDALTELLAELKKGDQWRGNFLGFLHALIGRRIARASDKTVLSRGLSWRDMAGLLKKLRWDPDAVQEIGLIPADLPPRDRQRFWYAAINHAKVDSSAAVSAGDRFAQVLSKLGYEVASMGHK